MLDAAVIMMQQYSAAAAFSVQMPQNGNQTASAEPDTTNPTANNPPTENVANGTTHANVSSTSSSTKAADLNKSNMASSSTAEPQAVSHEEELRRRRLQKFQHPQEQEQ